MAGAENRIILLHQLQHFFQLRHDFAVPNHIHTAVSGLAQLFQVVPGGRGGKPDHLGTQLQGILYGHGIYAANAAVQRHRAEHGEIILSVHPLVVSVCQIGAVGGVAQVGLDDDGPCPHPHGGIAKLKIIVGPEPQIRICVDVHINHALHGYFSHRFPPCFIFYPLKNTEAFWHL